MKTEEEECRAVEDLPDTLPLRTVAWVYLRRSLPDLTQAFLGAFAIFVATMVTTFVSMSVVTKLCALLDLLVAYCGGPGVFFSCLAGAVLAVFILNPEITLPWDFYHGSVNKYLE